MPSVLVRPTSGPCRRFRVLPSTVCTKHRTSLVFATCLHLVVATPFPRRRGPTSRQFIMSAGFGSKVGSNSPTALSVWASETDSLCCENEDTGSEMGDGSVDSCSSSPHTLRGNARRDDQIVCRCEIAMSELDDILALLQAALVDWEDPDQLLLRHGYCSKYRQSEMRWSSLPS